MVSVSAPAAKAPFLRDDKQGLLGSGASRIKELPSQESGVRIGDRAQNYRPL